MNQNPMQIIQQFNEFKNNFVGDPKQKVMELVQSGKISQQQLNQLQTKATQFQQLINNFNK